MAAQADESPVTLVSPAVHRRTSLTVSESTRALIERRSR